jgi:hypothetical protein
MVINKACSLLDVQTGKKIFLKKIKIKKLKQCLPDFNLESLMNLNAITLKSEI